MVQHVTVVILALGALRHKKEISFQVLPQFRGHEGAVAESVANISGLEQPRRIFRHGGKFEERHRRFGLDVSGPAFRNHAPALHMIYSLTSCLCLSCSDGMLQR